MLSSYVLKKVGRYLWAYYSIGEVSLVLGFLAALCRIKCWICSGLMYGFFSERLSSAALDEPM